MIGNSLTVQPTEFSASHRHLNPPSDAKPDPEPSKPMIRNRSSEGGRLLSAKDATTRAKVAFTVDKQTEELYIQVVDRETGEVLREIPPAEIRRLTSALEENFAPLVDTFA
jgi:flagellar protein FlaG